MCEIIEEKKQLRTKIKQLKAQVSLEEKKQRSRHIWEQLEREESFIRAQTVMLYWSMNDEVFTHDFVQKWQAQKQIILPAVEGDNLRLKVFEGMHTMVAGSGYGILEPVGKDIDENTPIDLVVVPGIAFDKQNNRMGRGKGFYDKLLCMLCTYKVGICFDFQLFEKIPASDLDIKMDKILSENIE